MDVAFDMHSWLGWVLVRYATGLCVFARFGGVLFTAPIISGSIVPVQIRIGIAGALAIIVTPLLPQVPAADTLFLLMCVVKEVMVGLVIGGTASLLFACGQMAGEWLDLQGGFQAAQILNPATDVQSSPLSSVKTTIAGLVFFGMGADQMVFRASARSFELSPPGALTLCAGTPSGWSGMLMQVVWISLQLALPIAATLFVTEAGFALASRAVPQMNVLLLATPAKTMIVVGGLALSLPVITQLLRGAFSTAPSMLDAALRMIAR